MFKRKLTISDFFLIAVNLVPVYGVWFEGWNAGQVFLVYCLETVIIGLVNILKMIGVTLFVKAKHPWNNNGSQSMQSGFFFIFFFIAHYGMFAFIQTQIFLAVSNLGVGSIGLSNYRKIPEILGDQGKLLLLIFVVYYTFDALIGFFGSGQYKNISMMRLMFQPYVRIFVQQVIVILGSIFLSFGAGKIFILIVAVIKTFANVFLDTNAAMEKAEKMQDASAQKVKRSGETGNS